MDSRRRELERRGREGDPSAALASRLAFVRDEDASAQGARLTAFVEAINPTRRCMDRPQRWQSTHAPLGFRRELAGVVRATLPNHTWPWKRRARTYAGSLAYPGNTVALVVHVEGFLVLGVRESTIESLGGHPRWPAMGCSPAWFSEAWPELGVRKPAIARERHDRLSEWAFRESPDRIMVREGVAFTWADAIAQAHQQEIRARRPPILGAINFQSTNQGQGMIALRLGAQEATVRLRHSDRPIYAGSVVVIGEDGLVAPMSVSEASEGGVLGRVIRVVGDGTVDVSIEGDGGWRSLGSGTPPETWRSGGPSPEGGR